MHVVSLLPAATDTVAALGLAHALVAVTHECDGPGSIAALPRVTSSAVASHAEAGEVDRQVSELASTGAPVFRLDDARIEALRPDLLLTQRVCDVCAVSEGDVRALAARVSPEAEVVTLGASTLAGVLDDIRSVARALGAAERGEALVAELEARMRRVHETLKGARAPRPRVAVVEWTDPPYAAGHWVPEMVRRAGGIDVLASPGEHSRPRTAAEIEAADPEVVLVSPCGYDVGRAHDEARRLLARDEWAWARGRRVWALDANGIVSRPGPRLVEGIEAMAAIVAPGLFPAPDQHAAIRVES